MRATRRPASLSLLALFAASCNQTERADSAASPPDASATAKRGGASIEDIGVEVALTTRLEDGDEFAISTRQLLDAGELFFTAVVTPEEGAGRPLTKGTGDPLTDPDRPLVFPFNFDRVSARDSNACSSCHNEPVDGGGGHFSANALVPGQRFDFLTFDHDDTVPTRGALDEEGKFPTLQTVANDRLTLGMNGSGFIEMLARQMTIDLQDQRDGLAPGDSVALSTKGVSFGTLSRDADGAWDTSAVEGLPAQALATDGPTSPPTFILQPFHQSATVVSIRQFTNNALNHHLGLLAGANARSERRR